MVNIKCSPSRQLAVLTNSSGKVYNGVLAPLFWQYPTGVTTEKIAVRENGGFGPTTTSNYDMIVRNLMLAGF